VSSRLVVSDTRAVFRKAGIRRADSWLGTSGAGSILARVGTGRVHLVAVEAPDEPVEASLGTRVPLAELEPPRARRPGWPTLAALAVGCGVAALALGAWALVAETRAEPRAPAVTTPDEALVVLTDSHAERYPLRGSVGRITLVVGDADRAVLALDGLGPAPAGREYAAWVVAPGSASPLPAAAFDGRTRAVTLARRVPSGARVGVTLEQTGASLPSRPLRLVAVRNGA
jgi:hypothetical protein